MNNYYSEHSKEYIDNTKNADMANLYSFFLKWLNKDSKRIMDLGFGSGRDSLYFKSLGYSVCSIDPTKDFCDNAVKLELEEIRCISAQELDCSNEFDGIWACASLLHIPSNELNDVFKKCFKALKENGVMYVSFKYGNFEGIRNDRYFIDLNEESIKEYIDNTGFIIEDIKITNDVRPNRNEKWLNVILKKEN